MSFNLGLNVVETDGKATPSIVAAPTSVAGFSIRSARGVEGKVTKVTNWQQFQETFGGYMINAFGAYTIRGFFDNGGTTAYITRVLGPASDQPIAASVTTNTEPWNLEEPSDNLRFEIDSGMVTAESVEAIFSWHATSLEAKDPDENGFYQLAGVEVQIITGEGSSDVYAFADTDFASNDADSALPEEVANVFNREFGGIKSFVEDGRVVVETDLSTELEIIGTDITNLFSTLSEPRNPADNVKDIDKVTLAEAEQVIAQALSSSSATVRTQDGQIVVEHTEPGAAHSLSIDAASTALQPNRPNGFTFTEVPGADSGASAIAGAATGSITGALSFTAGRLGEEDKGSWANDNVKIDINENSIKTETWDLVVTYKDEVVETWQELSMDSASRRFFETIINDTKYGSKYITVTGSSSTDPTGTSTLTGGNDGAAPTDNQYKSSFDLFELHEIQLLCCPESTGNAVVKAGFTHCSKMGDRMYVGYTPKEQDADSMKANYSGQFQGDKVYGALYFPWILVADPIGVNKWIPPTGHIMGVYARTERERGIWKAPAGNAARLKNVLDVYKHISDKQHTDLVKEASVNAVRFKSGKGIVIDSSRTLSTNPLWYYVNVRLLFNFIKSSLLNSLTWVIQEPNDPSLWNKVKFNSVTPFLMSLWRRGAFGPGSADEVFTVKIDAENNTPADIQQGRLNLEVYFYPSRPAETIVITIGQQEGGGSASES